MQISVIFDPATDDLDEVLLAVETAFGIIPGAEPYTPPNVIPASAPVGTQPMLQQSAETFRAGEQAAQAATTGNLSVTDIDAEGFAWDARIHSTPAKKTDKGVWRAKRGADPQVVARVKAAQIAARTATAAPVSEPAAPAAPVMPAAPVAPAAPAMPPTPYAELIGVIGRHTYDAATNPTGRINADWVQQYLTNWGVPGGMVENVATMDVGVQSQIVSAFKQALGE